MKSFFPADKMEKTTEKSTVKRNNIKEIDGNRDREKTAKKIINKE